MKRRHPLLAGVASACLLGALAGCSDPAPELSDLDDDEAAACAEVVAALPASIFGQELTERDERTATYGEVRLTCGVPMAQEYTDSPETALCSEVAGVGWYTPDAVLSDGGADLVSYALTRSPLVRLDVPADLRLEGTDAALTALGPPLAAHLSPALECL